MSDDYTPVRPADALETAIAEAVGSLHVLLELARTPDRTPAQEQAAIVRAHTALSAVIEAALGKGTGMASTAAIGVIRAYRADLDAVRADHDALRQEFDRVKHRLDLLLAEIADGLLEA